MSKKERLIIRHRWALGDTVLLSALVRDIHLAYPDKYEIMVDTNFSNVWWNNPYVTKFEESGHPRPQKITVSWGDAIKWNAYARVNGKHEMKHILAWYHYDFERKTGIHVPVTDPKADLYLDAQELKRRVQGRYWVIVSGGKLDVTVKHWHAHRAQEVVDKLYPQGIRCVQVGAVNQNHIHPPLTNVNNLVGKTENARDLWNLIAHSEGVICGVTAAMHIAAAYDKPCVVYAGGREEPWFEAYVDSFKAFGKEAKSVKVPHKYLHTIGLLDCCDKQGCWKKRTVALDPIDLSAKSHTLCKQPVRPDATHPVAKCQDLLLSDHVVEAVMSYYESGMLPPIQPPKKEYTTQNPDLKPDNIVIPQVELVKISAGDVKSKKFVAEEAANASLVREPSTANRKQPPYMKVHPLELQAPANTRIDRRLAVMDNDIIGGKLTVFVLCYGPHTNIAKRCINSILATLPDSKLDLRVGTNQAPQETLDYLHTLPVTKIYEHKENDFKYPVMREMFWDADCPIETNYFVWFDDDTWTVKPQWVDDLCTNIINFHPYNDRMFGNLMYHDLSRYLKKGGDARKWFKAADWYKGKDFRIKGQQTEAPNGSVIDFAVGWCWAMATEAMRAANIPDVRLGHNGGDITIGEQMHQAGFGIRQWNRGKSLISCPSREQGGRRGYSEKFPWDPTK